MNSKDLEFICCPKCKGDLQCSFGGVNDEPKLSCRSCNVDYPVIRGIPILAPREKDGKVKVVTETFGKRWTQNWKNMEHMQYTYTPSLYPLSPESFRNKAIIDAGCGFGPLSKFFLDNGARHVLCIDYSDAIFKAQDFLKAYSDRVTFVYGDIVKPALKPVFDMFVSHGVLIHVSSASAAYNELSKAVRPKGGTGFIWVYSKEGNRFLYFMLEAIRAVTLRLPFALNWWLAYSLETIMSLVVYGVYLPLEKLFGLGRKLWFGFYFLDFLYNPEKGGTRKYRYNMIHDALCTPIANHFSKEEIEGWIKKAGYLSYNFMFFRNQSWSVAASYSQEKGWNQGDKRC